MLWLLEEVGEKHLGYDNFKSNVCNYFSSFENTRKKVSILRSALDRVVSIILPKRDGENIFLVRDFTNTKGLKINLIEKNVMCYYSTKERKLITGVVCPNWDRGWRNVSKDKFVSEQIDFLFHFITQYIYRSYQINLIGAIALGTGIATDFRGNTSNFTYGEVGSQEIILFKRKIARRSSIESKKIIGYLKLINALDPYVNKVIFYYIRFLQLEDSMFTEESLTAADNMVDIICQSIKVRLGKPTQERKDMCNYVYKEIEYYNESDIYNLERLYLLRCRFTAHPGKSKWWDFYEIYEDDIDKIKLSVRGILISYLKYENNNRIVESHPVSWSAWFKEYCDIIYDAVWFHDIP